MITSGNTIYCTQEELDYLKQSAEYDGLRFAGSSIEVVSEAFLQFAKTFYQYDSLEAAFAALGQALKPEPKRFRCRVCGRKYDYKSEAKACERDHRQWRRS